MHQFCDSRVHRRNKTSRRGSPIRRLPFKIKLDKPTVAVKKKYLKFYYVLRERAKGLARTVVVCAKCGNVN